VNEKAQANCLIFLEKSGDLCFVRQPVVAYIGDHLSRLKPVIKPEERYFVML